MSETIPTVESSTKAAAKNMKALAREMPPRLARLAEDSVLRAKNESRNLLDRLDEFYGSVDEVLGFVLRRTPCKRGCSACCHYKVELFGIEVAYLERSLGIRRNPPVFPVVEPHGLPCPFLLGDECSIYRHRPYSCRQHVILDRSSYWCQPSRANTTDLLLFRVNKFDEAMAVLAMQYGTGEHQEIRNVFPTGLQQKMVVPPAP